MTDTSKASDGGHTDRDDADFTRIMVVEDNWRKGTTVVHDFGSNSRAALDFLHEREDALFPWTGPERVCYFRADGIDGLRQTHGNWFHEAVTVVDHT